MLNSVCVQGRGTSFWLICAAEAGESPMRLPTDPKTPVSVALPTRPHVGGDWTPIT
jgi:hypothetical protein